MSSDFPVVLYGRASIVRDDTSTSVDDQLGHLRAWAAREHWRVIGEYRDDNISASRYAAGKTRPDWERVMDVIASGQLRGGAALLWEFSRSTRDMEVYAALNKACRTHGVLLGYAGRLYDLDTSSDAFVVGLDALTAARRSDEISEQVQRSVESRATRGRPHSALPYGYRRVRDPNTGRVVGWEIHPDEGPIVREIVERLLEGGRGNSSYAIARDLNRRGIPTPASGRCTKDCGCRHHGRSDPTWDGEHTRVSGRWTSPNLSKLALRPSLAGIRTWNKGRVEPQPLDGVQAAWPPLISREDHDRLKAIFGSPERDKWRNSTHVRHLGTGIFRCGREGCEGRMRVVAYPHAGTYQCRQCWGVSRKQADVDDWVRRVMVARLRRPDVLEVVAGAGGEQRTAAVERVAALRAEEVDAQRLLRAGEITLADMAVWRKGWAPRMEAAEAAARPPESVAAVASLSGPDARRLWDAAAVGVRREVVDRLAVVTILPTGRRGGRPQPFDPHFVRIEFKGR